METADMTMVADSGWFSLTVEQRKQARRFFMPDPNAKDYAKNWGEPPVVVDFGSQKIKFVTREQEKLAHDLWAWVPSS